MSDPAADETSLRQVLARYGLRVGNTRRLPGGYQNLTWKVQAGDRTVVVRRQGDWRRRSPASIRWQHRLIAHLAAQGIPVAAPVTATDGTTLQIVGGKQWSVYPFRAGRTETGFPDLFHGPSGLRRQLAAIDALVDLHRAAASFPEPRQCPRAGERLHTPAWSHTLYKGTLPLPQVLLKAARPAPDSPGQQALADSLAEVRTVLDMVSAAAADPVLAEVPRIPIHGDYQAGNLGFRGERLSAIYDLDDSARDLRVMDVSKPLIRWCRRPDGTLDRRRFTRLFARYQLAYPMTAAEVRHFWAAGIAMDLLYLLPNMSVQVSGPEHDYRWALSRWLRPNIALLADLQKHGDPL